MIGCGFVIAHMSCEITPWSGEILMFKGLVWLLCGLVRMSE